MARKKATAVEAENTALTETVTEGEEGAKNDTPTLTPDNGETVTQGNPDAQDSDLAALECDCLVEDDGEDESIPKFSKEQLLKSNWYSHKRDLLTALLKDDRKYSHNAVDKLIGEFMKGKVN